MSFDAGQFRAQVQAFCREQFPADLARKADTYVHFSKADRVRWQRLLDERGWFIGHWPVEFGGQGWGPLQRFIFIEELEYAGTPWLTHFGVSFAGPLLCTFGSARPATTVSAGDPQFDRLVVPGLFRARCRLRSGVGAHARAACGR